MLVAACLVVAWQTPLLRPPPRFAPQMCEQPGDESASAWDAIASDLKGAVKKARGMTGGGADALEELDDFALRAIQRLENRFGAQPSGPSIGGFQALTKELTANLEEAGTALSSLAQRLSRTERELSEAKQEVEEGRKVAAETVSALDDLLEKAQDAQSGAEKAMRSADERANKAEDRASKADAAAAQATAAAGSAGERANRAEDRASKADAVAAQATAAAAAAAEAAAAATTTKAETEARMQAIVTAADRRAKAAEQEMEKLLCERDDAQTAMDAVLEEEALRKYNRKRERLRRALRSSRERFSRVLGQ